MTGKCTSSFQPFPTSGRLAQNFNVPLLELMQRVGAADRPTYSYVMSTVRFRDRRFQHAGPGPNFQGGLLTLCTCKHRMRSARSVEEWPGCWVAGFSGLQAGGGKNALVYLTRVRRAFESAAELWFSEELSDIARQAKAANRTPFGDLFEPSDAAHLRPFEPSSYRCPTEEHCHYENAAWHRDIDYVGFGGRRAALLVGEPALTFLWDRPLVFFEPFSIGRNHRRMPLDALLSSLQMGAYT